MFGIFGSNLMFSQDRVAEKTALNVGGYFFKILSELTPHVDVLCLFLTAVQENLFGTGLKWMGGNPRRRPMRSQKYPANSGRSSRRSRSAGTRIGYSKGNDHIIDALRCALLRRAQERNDLYDPVEIKVDVSPVQVTRKFY